MIKLKSNIWLKSKGNELLLDGLIHKYVCLKHQDLFLLTVMLPILNFPNFWVNYSLCVMIVHKLEASEVFESIFLLFIFSV